MRENKLIKLNVGKFQKGGFIPSAREMYENEINIYGKKPNISNFMIGGETLREPNPITTPQQETYQQENKTPVDIQAILDRYNTQGQFTETSPEDHEILLNYILSERERDEIQNGIKQKGGIVDPNGYLISNLSNFTPVKVVNGDANGTNITTNGMAFPILANGKQLFPNTGNYQFKESKVVEYPMFQTGGRTPIYVSDKNDPRLRSYQDSAILYNYMLAQKKAESSSAIKAMMGIYTPEQWNKQIELAKMADKIIASNPNMEPQYKDMRPKGFTYMNAKENGKFNPMSPDIVHKKIKPSFEWWGHGLNLGYKKPVQPVFYDPSKVNNTLKDNKGNIVSTGINKRTEKPQLVQIIQKNSQEPNKNLLNQEQIISRNQLDENTNQLLPKINYTQDDINISKINNNPYNKKVRYYDPSSYHSKQQYEEQIRLQEDWLNSPIMDEEEYLNQRQFKTGGKTTTSSTPFDPYFQQAEKKYNLPSGLLKGIAATESAFDPDIIAGNKKSSAGAIGLMQFMAPTAKQYGIDPTDPIQSIDAAGRMVSELYSEFGNYDDALRAYNFGSGNLKKAKAGKKDIPLETAQYVGKVYKNANLKPEVENQFDIYKETLGVGSRKPKRSKMNFFKEEDYTIQEEIEEQEEVEEVAEQIQEEQEIQEEEQEIQSEVDETNEEQFMSAEEIENEMLNIQQEERRSKVLNFLNSFNS